VWLRKGVFAGAEGTVCLFFSGSPSSFNICFSGSSNCFSPLSPHLSPSFLRFSANKWPVLQRKFFGGFPQLFFSTISTFVSQLQQMASASEKVLWKVPTTVLVLQKKLFGGFPELFFSTYVSQFPATLCNKWLVLQKRWIGGFSQLFFSTYCFPVSYHLLRQMAGWCFRKGSFELFFSAISTFVSRFPAILCNKLRARASEKVLWRVPTTVFLYVCPPVSCSPECCVNSRHLPSVDTSTLRRCWVSALPLCFASFPQVVYASQWLVKRRASLLTSTTAGDSTSRMWGFSGSMSCLVGTRFFAEGHPETHCIINGTLYLEAVAPIIFVHHIMVWVLIHSSPWIRRSRYVSAEMLLPTLGYCHSSLPPQQRQYQFLTFGHPLRAFLRRDSFASGRRKRWPI